ncbi:DUF4153 domain-containing protein [Brevibacillus formosus]|uniref:DUF4153 domain-containing protein n=1 Tax=Brevibacillus formosus TaxID=54913 RepID=UPI0027E3FE34|nr:DUF4173 domain-containing protein [Brevibacillus formosus]
MKRLADVAQEQKGLQWLLLGAFGIGILFDWMFYGKGLGISYLLFVIGLYGLFIWQARQRIQLRFSRKQVFDWIWTLPIFLLALTFFLFSNPHFHLFNLVLIPILFMIQTLLITKRHQAKWYEAGFFMEMVETLILYTPKYTRLPFRLIKERIKDRLDQEKYGVMKKVFIGIGISVPLLVIVLSLLSNADSVFGHFLGQIPRRVIDVDSLKAIFRMMLIGLITILVFAYMYSLFGKREEVVELPMPEDDKKIVWDGVILVTILAIINIVYTAFTYIQISYLFSGAKRVLPDELTYAEYARNGFNELVTVTVINFLILLCTMHFASRAKPMLYRIIQVLLSMLTICTGFMLVSAYFRLSLYEDAYGYTHTRLLAHVFMIFLFVLFIIALLKIWRDKFSLIKYYAILTLVSYVILNYINMDVIIAKNNVQRYHATGNIDIEYLSELSYDAIPVVMELVRDKKIEEKFMDMLQERKEILYEDNSWQSFNLSEYRAKAYLP